MTDVRGLTTQNEVEAYEVNVVENALTRAETVIKFLIKENDELKIESYTNKVYADEYKSYCNDLETKLDNCMLENSILKSKLNYIYTAASAAISENLRVRELMSKDIVAAASAAASKSLLKAYPKPSPSDDMLTNIVMIGVIVDDLLKTKYDNVMNISVTTALLDIMTDGYTNVVSNMKSISKIATFEASA